MNNIERTCKTCIELKKVQEYYRCAYHDVEIFIPENASCENYILDDSIFENKFTELLRDLELLR